MLYCEKIKNLSYAVSKLSIKIRKTKEEALFQVLEKIKKNEQYKRSFFMQNWKIIFLFLLIDGEDYQTQDYENGIKYKNIDKFLNNEVKSHFSKSISEISNLLIFETNGDKKDYIEVFDWSDSVYENFNGSCDFTFNINGFQQICEFYSGDLHVDKTQLFQKLTKYLEECFRQCNNCKYHAVCKTEKQYNKKIFCLDNDKK